VSRFGETGMVAAKCDRSVDPYTHIDHIRDEIVTQNLRQDRFALELQALKNSDRAEWTKTGIWYVVKAKLDEEAVDWLKWFIRGAAAAVGSGLLALLVWVLKLAWKGLHT
jgi:hypothetical protein